jgi:hypothetical protein
MANNLRISHQNGIFRAERDLQTVGQARDIETLIHNAVDEAFPEEVIFHAAEVIRNMLGPTSNSHGQIHTKEPS